MKIALDAMGGDEAPLKIVEGGLQALKESGNRFELVLVGRQEEIKKEVKRLDGSNLNYSIVDAPDVIEMSDPPNLAIKQKPNSSIVVGLTIHKEGKVDAFVSAGNTGAVMSASTLILGRAAGVTRPSVGTPLPTISGSCFVLDSGASSDCRPHHLAEFAVMGAVYASEIMKIKNPRVGLLNIGEERTKGNELALASYALLEKSGLNFIGNVEGRDILMGKADVIVTDGFVGNIVLKFAESILPALRARLTQYSAKGIIQKLQAFITAKTLRKAMKGFSYEAQGGAPLLGVKGVTIIGHGSSTPLAVKNMIFRAEEMVSHGIASLIENSIGKIDLKVN